MNILVTGGAGFLGSHLVRFLLNTANKVVILDRLDSTVNLDRITTSIEISDYIRSGKLKFVWWDLKAELNEQVIEQLGDIDLVYHCAASSHVTRSIEDPMLFIQDNVVGTCNLLKYIVNNNKPMLIHISTDEVFGPAGDNPPYKELDSTWPTNPYSASKAAAESLVIAYTCTYNIDAIIVRCTNILGTGQHDEKFIPLVLKNLIEGKTTYIHSDGTGITPSTRYYIDIRDIVSALINLNQHDCISKDRKGSGIYHLTGKEAISNLFIVEYLAKKLNIEPKYKLVPFDKVRPNHDQSYAINGDMTECVLEWKPKYSIEETLNWILDLK